MATVTVWPPSKVPFTTSTATAKAIAVRRCRAEGKEGLKAKGSRSIGRPIGRPNSFAAGLATAALSGTGLSGLSTTSKGEIMTFAARLSGRDASPA